MSFEHPKRIVDTQDMRPAKANVKLVSEHCLAIQLERQREAEGLNRRSQLAQRLRRGSRAVEYLLQCHNEERSSLLEVRVM